jgi:hypothetical protein
MTARAHDNVVPLPRRAPVAWVQGTLALSLADPDADIPPASVHALAANRSHVDSWAGRFAQAATEIAGGNRPVTQLLRHTTPVVYADLARRAQLVAGAVGIPSGQGLLQAVRPVVESVHTCWLEPEVVEASARIRYGERCRALAFRLERRQGRWITTALEFA